MKLSTLVGIVGMIIPQLCSAQWISGWKSGPSLNFGFPHPINLGFEMRSETSDFSLAAMGGYLPLSFNVQGSPVGISIGNVDVRGRWHPFHGAFFIGLGMGYQWLGGSATETITTTAPAATVVTDVAAKQRTFTVTPHIGWLWIFDSGFFFGVDIGRQLGKNSTTDITIGILDPSQQALLTAVQQTAQYQALESRIEDGINKIGDAKFPYFTLIKLGWFF